MGGVLVMAVLITLLILAFIAWATFTQVMARQQTSVSCSCEPATARRIVSKCFGMWWTAVPGKGDDNFKSKRGSKAPVISISYDMSGTGGCDVDIWCSHSVKQYGLLNHGQMVWRKKRAVARALAQADLGSRQARVSPSISGAVPLESPRPQSLAQPRIDASGRERILSQMPEVGTSQDQGNEESSGWNSLLVPRHELKEATVAANRSCVHSPGSHMEFGEIKIKGDPPYRYREFWQVTACTKCGEEMHREADEYYGDDMADIHWKWSR
jgi:hypothetical protein